MIAGSMVLKDSSSESTVRQFAARSAIHEKVLAEAGNGAPGRTVRLTKDFVFTSPSAAAAVVQGHATANGRKDWVTAEGLTFAAWETPDVTTMDPAAVDASADA